MDTITRLKIGRTDVFLENGDKEGQGKTTIADPDNGAFTFYWGSMGGDIFDFMLRINAGYFSMKLCGNQWVFDPKSTLKRVRREIRDTIHWYQYMGPQKELRESIKKVSGCTSADTFIVCCAEIVDNIKYWITYDDQEQEKDFHDTIIPIFETEPWHMVCEKPSQESLWLEELHGKIQAKIKAI